MERAMSDEHEIEAAIQATRPTAPRLTPGDIDGVIVREEYWTVPETTVMVCALVLRNGFVVTGVSASGSPANFNEAIGREVARRNARDRIWEFEGYLLRERLAA